MTDDELFAAIAVLGGERMGWGPGITPGTRLIEDLHLDSLQLLTLAVEVENRFRVRIPPDDEAGVRTVGDLVAVVRRHLSTD